MSPPARLSVRLTPRGGRDALEGWAIDAAGRTYLKARVTAPPVDGAANEALRRLIARTLDRPVSAVRIVSGEHGRMKQVEIEGIDAAELERHLGGGSPRPRLSGR